MLLVPHLDRIYAEMGRLCAGRDGDPHRWINPEFHGWWVLARLRRRGRCARPASWPITTDFIARFRQSYHPRLTTAASPVIHPQPAGIAVTDSDRRRSSAGTRSPSCASPPDRTGAMRVYFYNPNNDSGQDWGAGVTVSTDGNGERHGEASLPFEQFVSRLYLFHDEPVRRENKAVVPAEAVARVRDMALASWAADRMPDMPTASTGRRVRPPRVKRKGASPAGR